MVHGKPGKSWKFRISVFIFLRPGKSWKLTICHGKWKIKFIIYKEQI